MLSRRKSREYLLQILYTHTKYGSAFDKNLFDEMFFEGEDPKDRDTHYIETLEREIHTHEKKLIGLIAELAPKFELESMPVIHIIILLIALAEMLGYVGEEIPESISINEAVELAKRFSDDNGKNFINGTLATFQKDKESIIQKATPSYFTLF